MINTLINWLTSCIKKEFVHKFKPLGCKELSPIIQFAKAIGSIRSKILFGIILSLFK